MYKFSHLRILLIIPLFLLLLSSCQPTPNYEIGVSGINFPVTQIDSNIEVAIHHSSQLSYCQSNSLSGKAFDVIIAEIDSTLSSQLLYRASSQSNVLGIGCNFFNDDLAWFANGKSLIVSEPIVNGLFSIERISNDEFAEPKPFLKLPQYTDVMTPMLISVSPNSNKLALVSSLTNDSYFPSIYVVSEDGKDISLIYEADGIPGIISRPVWSYEGDKIAFTSPLNSTGYSENGLVVIDANTEVVVAKFTSESHPEIPAYSEPLDLANSLPDDTVAWLPGGKLIFFITKGESQTKNILWVASLVNEELMRIREGQIKDIATSPQGDKLAVMIHTENGDMIEIINLDQNLTSLYVINYEDFSITSENLIMQDMDWSKDGQNLAFSVNLSGQFDLYLFQETTHQIIQITKTSSTHEIGATWSP